MINQFMIIYNVLILLKYKKAIFFCDYFHTLIREIYDGNKLIIATQPPIHSSLLISFTVG